MFMDDGKLLVGSFMVVVDDELTFIDWILIDIKDFSCGERFDVVGSLGAVVELMLLLLVVHIG